jgi:DNA-binding XRE family transcriptional regulator
MNGKTLSKLRDNLGKTQIEMARLLGVSYTTKQSYEQGWRRIPTHAERQELFLLAMKMAANEKMPACWEVKKCTPEKRERCPAWEF